MTISGKHISDNRELFVFLPWEEVSVSHSHGDILVTHELLQLHECDPAGLRQPGCEGMPHGVQGHGVQAVAVFLGSKPIIYLFGLICFAILVKVIKNIIT